MKIYKRQWNDDFEGTCISWHASKKEAEDKSSLDTNDIDDASITIEAVNFPATKQGVLRWLNTHLNRDNG